MTRDGPIPLKEVRQRLLSLSKLQTQLRTRLNAYMRQHRETVAGVSRRAGISSASLGDFKDSKLCMCSGQALAGLCALLNCADLGAQIEEVAAPLPDRYRGMGCFGSEAISTAVDLMVAQQEWADRLNFGEFAEAFGKYAKIVEGALRGSQEALEALSDEKINHDVVSMLLEDLDARLETLAARKQEHKQAAALQLEALISQLLGRYGSKTVIARELGLGNTTLHAALGARSSLETLETAIRKAEALLKRPPPEEPDYASLFQAAYAHLYGLLGSQQKVADALGAPASTVSYASNGRASKETYASLVKQYELLLELSASLNANAQPTPKPEPTPQAAATNQASISIPATDSTTSFLEALAALADSRTWDGVQFVVTSESFRPIIDSPVIVVRDALMSLLPPVRALLILACETEDTTERRILQRDIGKQVRELQLAVEAFSAAHPNELLELFDGQREFWAAQRDPRPKGRR